MSNSPAVVEPALPELAATPALEIGTDDVQLPRLYMGQPNGQAVTDGIVPAHCLWVGLGADDPDPNVIWLPEAENAKAAKEYAESFSDVPVGGSGIVCHVLDMRKGKSATIGDDLFSYNFRNAAGQFVNRDGEVAPDDAKDTYNYVVCLPTVDQDVPIKLLLKSTSAKTAQRINYQLLKASGQGPSHALAFNLTTKGLKKEQYRYTVMNARLTEAMPKNVLIADAMVRMLGDRLEQAAVETVDEPAI